MEEATTRETGSNKCAAIETIVEGESLPLDKFVGIFIFGAFVCIACVLFHFLKYKYRELQEERENDRANFVQEEPSYDMTIIEDLMHGRRKSEFLCGDTNTDQPLLFKDVPTILKIIASMFPAETLTDNFQELQADIERDEEKFIENEKEKNQLDMKKVGEFITVRAGAVAGVADGVTLGAASKIKRRLSLPGTAKGKGVALTPNELVANDAGSKL